MVVANVTPTDVRPSSRDSACPRNAEGLAATIKKSLSREASVCSIGSSGSNERIPTDNRRIARGHPWRSTKAHEFSLAPDAYKRAIEERGYAVLDNSCWPGEGAALRKEILSLHKQGHLTSSGNSLTVKRDKGITAVPVMKPNVHEMDVVTTRGAREDALAKCPALKQYIDSGARKLQDRLQRGLTHLGVQLTGVEQCKIQVNAGDGGAFPFHFDLPPDDKPGTGERFLTAILYLNPGWSPEDGGELEMAPLPHKNQKLAPIDGRLVTFLSQMVLHRVCPYVGKSPRVNVCLWFSAKSIDTNLPMPLLPASNALALPANIPENASKEKENALDWFRKLRNHPDQYRAFCKVFFEDEFIQGLEECFPTSPDLDDAIDFHEMEAGRIRARLADGMLATAKSAYPLPCSNGAMFACSPAGGAPPSPVPEDGGKFMRRSTTDSIMTKCTSLNSLASASALG